MTLKNILLFLALSLLTASSWARKSRNTSLGEVHNFRRRIISGSMAKRQQFPYMVSVRYKDKHQCGGAILSPSWVVSAAHCYAEVLDQSDLEVVAGQLMLDEIHPDVQKSSVSDLILHPNFHYSFGHLGSSADLALLQLQTSFALNQGVRQIGLPQLNQDIEGTIRVCGWGLIQLFPPSSPLILQYTYLNVITIAECKHYYQRLYGGNLCAMSSVAGTSTCSGDSGSPAVQEGILVGVVSFADNQCGVHGQFVTPTVFTRISTYVGFIMSHVKDRYIYTRGKC